MSLSETVRQVGLALAGAGLGLTIVRNIAALQAARIALDDNDHGGLTVRVYFPV